MTPAKPRPTMTLEKGALLWCAEFPPPYYTWGVPSIRVYGVTRRQAIKRARARYEGIVEYRRKKDEREKVEL